MTDVPRDVLKKEESYFGIPSADIAKFKKYATYTLLTFALMYMFFYNGRQNIGLALPSMREEMGWSASQVGVLSSVLFWTYGFGHLVNGRLGEALGAKRFMIVGVLLSILCNVLISFQNTLFAITVLWGLNGYFQSMVWCPGVNLVSKWWPSSRRGFATGVYTGSAGIASIVTWLSVLVAFQLFPQDGWRAAFRYPILLIISAVILFGLLAKNSPKDVDLPNYVEEDEDAQKQDAEHAIIAKEKGKLYPFIFLFSNWRFVLWCFIVAFQSIARYGLLTWIPSYFVSELDMNIKQGIIGSIVLPIGMALGSFLIPWATDKLGKNGKSYAVVACAIIAGIFVFIFPTVQTVSIAAILLFFSGFFVYAINGVVWVYAGAIGGRSFSGTASGILDWAAYMGAALQSLVFGFILDATGSYLAVFTTMAVVCILMAVLAFIASRESKSANSPRIV
jgi:sugar phosphate permease